MMDRFGQCSAVSAGEVRDHVVTFIRAFGLHRPDQTPCGQPLAVSEAHALMEIHAREPLSQARLASLIQLEKSTVSRLIRRLEEKGWIERRRAENDGRVIDLRLSPEGRTAAVDLSGAQAEKFARILANIPASEQREVLHSLRILVAAMEATTEKGG